MPEVTRIGDSTTGTCDKGLPCCPHGRSGTNGTGRPRFRAGGKLLHCLSDTGATNCPHGGTYESVQGSEKVRVDGLPVTLVGHGTLCKSCGEVGSHSSGWGKMRIAK
ncbi:PAAR motif-containing protein [Dethiosulfovibrio salsuginis]|uniref:PAAR motif-containing protein n=1 Tax=Dethiosulfovibrio salsuginis TaxID=561720 RepID=A0A1X7L2K3_9BACT|nr:PAAR motif-containing protein [Dethiosulfovibrio salsuginis]